MDTKKKRINSKSAIKCFWDKKKKVKNTSVFCLLAQKITRYDTKKTTYVFSLNLNWFKFSADLTPERMELYC